MKIQTWEVTGFGGGYEATTQKMIWNAVKFLSENKSAEIDSKQSNSFYGICLNEGKDGKDFDKAMMNGINDATGAMHQCATNHALYIAKNGYYKWYSELKTNRETKEAFEFDYDKEFELN